MQLQVFLSILNLNWSGFCLGFGIPVDRNESSFPKMYYFLFLFRLTLGILGFLQALMRAILALARTGQGS